MKRMMHRISLVAAILLAAFPMVGQASEVSLLTAEQVARTFWNLHYDKDATKLNSPMHRLDTDWDAFYIFAPAEGKGFVIVAADDRVRPVLAYSFHNNAMRDKMSPGIDGWQEQVDELRKEKGGERNQEWQQLLDGDAIPRSLTALPHMITTQLDQEEPYNDSCPTRIEYGSSVRALTGCVATAMAQVMMYHCGVACDMYYGSLTFGGSGFFTLNSLTPNIDSYTYNFSRGQQILVGMQPHTGNDSLCIIRQFPYIEDFETAPTGWEGSVSNLLGGFNAWLVVDSTGVDGNFSAGVFQSFFDESDDHMFSPSIVTPGDYKVNWQVCARQASGSDSYTLTVNAETFNDIVESTTWQSREFIFSVAEGDTVRLDFGHTTQTNSVGILIDNIVIEQQMTEHAITVSANPNNGGTVTGGGTYHEGDNCTVTATANEGYTFTNWTENGVEVVSEEMTYTFVANENRNLVAHFEYTEGIGEQSTNALVIYPNPVSDKLTIETQEDIGTVEIYNLMGAMVYSQKNFSNKMEINTSELQGGIYIIHLISPDNVAIRRVIKR